MAAPTQIGVVTVWGVDGTLAYTGLASTDNVLESVDLNDEAEVTRRRDNLGETKGVLIWDPRKTITVTFYPSDPSDISDSKDNIVLPAKGSTVTLASFPTNSGLNETTWIYEQGGSIGFTNEGEAKITLPLVKYNTDISTAPTP